MTACSTGPGELSAKQVEKKITAQLVKGGIESKKLSCPKPLKAEVDATTKCTYESAGITYSVKATATKVKDSKVTFGLKLSIVSATPELLKSQVTDQISAEQLAPSTIDCLKPLLAKNGATASCTFIANDLKYVATVTAHDVTETDIPFTTDVPPPAVVPTSTLDAQVKTLLGDQVESGIDSVSCPDELEGTIGKSVDCSVTATNGKKIDVSVTIDQADFKTVHFNIEQK